MFNNFYPPIEIDWLFAKGVCYTLDDIHLWSQCLAPPEIDTQLQYSYQNWGKIHWRVVILSIRVVGMGW